MQPDISEIWKNWFEVIAIFLGGCWAIYTWIYEVRSNYPSLDGDLTIESTILSKDLIAVSVCAMWNNRGKFPVKLSHNDCFVDVFKIAADLHPGNLFFDENQKGELRNQLFPKDITLEPKTESRLRAHFILQRGPVYFFRWKLTSHPNWEWQDFRKIAGIWGKTIIWNSSMQPNNPDEDGKSRQAPVAGAGVQK